MNGAANSLLVPPSARIKTVESAGATLLTNWKISAHTGAAAHHVVLNIVGFLETPALRFQPLQTARIFERRRPGYHRFVPCAVEQQDGVMLRGMASKIHATPCRS